MAELVEEVRRRVESHEPLVTTAAKLSRELDEPVPDVLAALRTLEHTGDVASAETGANAIAWWSTSRALPPNPTPADHPDQGSLTDVAEDADSADGVEEADREGAEDTGADSERARASHDVEDDDGDDSDELAARVRTRLEHSNPKKRHAKRATLDVWRLLREHGSMRTADLKAELWEEYADHYGSERAMWESLSRYLDDQPGIEKGAYGEWEYAGDDRARDELDP